MKKKKRGESKVWRGWGEKRYLELENKSQNKVFLNKD